jgi:hypothetical protein
MTHFRILQIHDEFLNDKGGVTKSWPVTAPGSQGVFGA